MGQIKYFLVALIVSHAFSTSLQCDYKPCPNFLGPGNAPFTHTMCQYNYHSYGAECEQVLSPGLTREEIRDVLDRHNEFRSQVAAGRETRGLHRGQPGGIIEPLAWDDHLAEVAQRWANQCHTDHDQCRDIDGIRIGQNLGWSGNLGEKFTDFVTKWYNEVENFDHRRVPNFESNAGEPVITHYTQLIWAKTTHVGCGGIQYKTSNGDGIFKRIYLVCNYRPMGNMIGEAVYEINDKFGGQSIFESDKNSPPNKYINEFTKEDARQSSYGPITERPSNVYSPHSGLLAKLSEKNNVKKSPYEFPPAEISYRRPSPQFNSRLNQNQGVCKYTQCDDEHGRGIYKQHTMCKYPTSTVVSTCGDLIEDSITEREEKQILDLHNEFKQQAVKDIERQYLNNGKSIGYDGPLQWDRELAEVAQRWANQCSNNHDDCRNINDIKVTQNIGQISFGGLKREFKDIVTLWYTVRSKYNPNSYPVLSDYETEYYTPLIWSNTTHVGCGGIKYYASGSINLLLVCNYRPQENMIGQAVNKITDESRGQSTFGPHKTASLYGNTNEIPEENTQKPFNRPRNEITNQRPGLPDNRPPPNRNQGVCEYEQCEDEREPGRYMQHTMCKYPTSTTATTCRYVTQSSLNEIEEEEILKAHEDFNTQVAEENERQGIDNGQLFDYHGPLQWNRKLAEVAQRWANQCQNSHDECRNIDHIEVSQNIREMDDKSACPMKFAQIVPSWYPVSEQSDSNSPQLQSNYESKSYTQFWVNTTDVGCGGIRYTNHAGLKKILLVCNYMLTENIAITPIQESSTQPDYTPKNNVPDNSVHKPIGQPDYNPDFALNNLTMPDPFDTQDCKFKPCEDRKEAGRINIHTMCHYRSTDIAEECHDVKKSSLNQTEKDNILSIHYDLIEKAYPNVAYSLRWNNELEKIAQRWANQCHIGFDICRTMLDGSHVRQHYGSITREHTFDSDIPYIIKSWNMDVPFENNISDIGCGIIQYIEDEMYNTYLVCNYKTPKMSNTQVRNLGIHHFGIEF